MNYTRLPNLVMLLLGLLQPGKVIALPVLESDSDSEDLLPYLRQADIEVQWYREEELTKKWSLFFKDLLYISICMISIASGMAVCGSSKPVHFNRISEFFFF